MSAFPYFAQVYRLLRVEPTASPTAEAEIAACEKKLGFRLPAAVREWYSHPDSDTLLTSGNGGFLPRKEVLKNFATAARSPDRTAAFYWWISGRSAEVRVPINGPDDPLTVAPPENAIHTPTLFSANVAFHAWWATAHESGARVNFGQSPAEQSPLRFGPPHLDWMMENFELLPQRPTNHKDWQEFWFFGPTGRVELTTAGDPRTGERQAFGTLTADSPDAVADLFVSAWPFHPGPVHFRYSIKDANARRRVRNRIRKRVPGVEIQ